MTDEKVKDNSSQDSQAKDGQAAKSGGGQRRRRPARKPAAQKAQAQKTEQEQPSTPQKKEKAPQQNRRKPASKQSSSKEGEKAPTKKTSSQPKKAKSQQAAKEPVQKAQKGKEASQNTQSRSRGRSSRSKDRRKPPVRIIPLGGLNEIGKNMTCYECGNDMFIVDCGIAFPDAEMPGVDLVIPDFSYVEKNADRLRGIVLTHGHEDHIGGLPFFLKKLNVPLYGTALTLGLVEGKLKEHGLLGKVQLNVVKPRQSVQFGCMSVEFIHVNHSIPDACAFAITTPAGVIIHTGDFKVDYSPIEGGIIDIARFAELGDQGVLCLLSESTNAERPGSTMSERKVGYSFDSLFANAAGKRLIVATFASNIHRIQQIVDNAQHYGRKVVVNGRSMVNVVAKAMELGYLNVPEGMLIDIDEMHRFPNDQIALITTGSQGEPMAALSRMASGDHRKVKVGSDDFIIISATPIPGNEKHVNRVVNDLLKLGADVVYEAMYEVHVSGHACQDELKMMLSLTKPKFFMPIHGEYKHLKKHAALAQMMGIAPNHIHIGDIGQVIELDGVDMKMAGVVPAGKVLVDGYGVGDVGSIVLRDRKHLAEDGLIVVVATIESEAGCIVAGPDIVSRGFVYVRESEELMAQARNLVKQVLEDCADRNVREWGVIKGKIKDELSNFIYRKTKRAPMILSVIMEI